MNICVISDSYPSPGRPEYPFVEQLCAEWSRQGHTVIVIAPQSITKHLVYKYTPIPYSRQESYGGVPVIIISPKYLSFGTFGTKYSFINNLFSKAVHRALRNLIFKPDIIYGHFWHNAFAAFSYAKKNRIPLFVASGESQIKLSNSNGKLDSFCNYVKGVICVSTKNLNESVAHSLTTKEKCKVLPNAIDSNLFYQHNRAQARMVLGIQDSDFIVAYVGAFIHRKGPDRVANAIRLLNNKQIKSIFIGNYIPGKSIEPQCDGILFMGKLPHNQIAEYLSAADVFVLPTLREGCCNAIIEAMACGLPIISSNLDFNHDILNHTNSILVDPHNELQISEAIESLFLDKKRREQLSYGAISTAQLLKIENRAASIINFINARLVKYG